MIVGTAFYFDRFSVSLGKLQLGHRLRPNYDSFVVSVVPNLRTLALSIPT